MTGVRELFVLWLIGMFAAASVMGCGKDDDNPAGGEVCDNNSDDDADFLIDCLDPDCLGDPACSRSGTEICNNNQDDDNDLRTDCDDFDCTRDPACRGDEICDNNRDDDNDHREDCDDPDCNGHAACRGDEICDNNRDDDNDGDTDCDDSDCTRACVEDCSNGKDDDGDGYEDCDDIQCCGVGTCAPCGTDPCPTYSSFGCETCVADYENDCGWCRTTNTCGRGSSQGPAEGSCTEWSWDFGECPGADPCASYSDCTRCVADDANNCGFCAATSRCVGGTAAGPTAGACSDWDWETSHCSGSSDPCAVFTSLGCAGCTGDPEADCGWCGDSNQCMHGSSTGPDTGTCNDWDWETSHCSGSSDPCAAFTSLGCAGCTADPEADCGWCGDSNQCMHGSSTGPDTGTCTSWSWLSESCQAANPCAVYDSFGCDACTADSENDCGWCRSTNQCLQGTGAGPNGATCDQWDWMTEHCASDPCAVLSSAGCAACVADHENDCGFCQDNNTCSNGNSQGPSSGTCTNWDWVANDCP